MHEFPIENWKRKEHFEFFSKMKSPYFGITTQLDCTPTYDYCKKNNQSFFATYLHKSTRAVNQVEELKLRIRDGKVYKYDTINAGSTIGRPDGTFGFSYTHFNEDFEIFNVELQKEIAEVQACSGIRFNDDATKHDLIRYSSLPWNSFSHLLHPTNFDPNDSVPRITFGKFEDIDGKKMLPVNIEAHHGLADGYHLSKYLEIFQKELLK